MKCSYTGCHGIIVSKGYGNKKTYKGDNPMCIECRRMSTIIQYIKKVEHKLTLLIYGFSLSSVGFGLYYLNDYISNIKL